MQSIAVEVEVEVSIYFTFVIENLHNFSLNFIPLFLCYICIINGKF